VVARKCPEPIGSQELFLVEHPGEDAPQPFFVHEGEDTAVEDAPSARPVA
jgi:hypothetical protein